MLARTKLVQLLLSFPALLGGVAGAHSEPATQDSQIAMAYVRQERSLPVPLSPVDVVARDAGLAGARLGIADNTTTGRFTGQSFGRIGTHPEIGRGPCRGRGRDRGRRGPVRDCRPRPIRARTAASAEAARGLTIINAGAVDDELRGEQCRANFLHTVPSRAMLADALAQYLMWKRWRRWFLAVGRQPGDRAYADAIRRAARKFGAEIVVEKEWTFQPGRGRADTGHVTLQTEVPAFTQVADHDVLVVADEADEFGEYLIGRTSRPRPVVGTHGIVATSWSPVAEQWGASQIQSRFSKIAGRPMNAIDYAAWAATRSIGEAAFRAQIERSGADRPYLRGPDFLLAGFKGQGQKLPYLGWADAPADPDCRSEAPGLRIAAARVPPSDIRTRHARARPRGNGCRF